MDRTGQRAEIKGRRGDEFVKKAEAGQQHASRTSKRQDEMKSNRCPSPTRLETLFPSPRPAAPSPFLYPLPFLSPDFLLPPSAPRFFPSSLSFLHSSVLHIRFEPPSPHPPVSFSLSFCLSLRSESEEDAQRETQYRRRGHANPLRLEDEGYTKRDVSLAIPAPPPDFTLPHSVKRNFLRT